MRCRCLTCPQELLDDRRACRDATPDRMQHLLASTWWDAAAACNDVRDYVVVGRAPWGSGHTELHMPGS